MAGKTKPQADQYPNATGAGPHFKWDELLKSAGSPGIAAKYRNLYPGGKWPHFLDPAIWTGRYRLSDGIAMSKKMLPKLINRPLSENMAEHITTLVEPLRAHLGGKPLTIISGWRPPELNQSSGVGGARQSAHLMGIATDVAADPQTKKKAREWAIQRERTHGDIGLFITYSWGFHISSLRGFKDHRIFFA